VIRTRPAVTPATALAITVSPLIHIEAPQADAEAGEHSASNHGEEEDRQRFLD
jgi:hypothetical protein